MQKYQLVFLLKPPEIFGLPVDGITVVPSDAIPNVSATLDSKTGNVVSHGAISRFRENEFQKRLKLGSVNVELRDNFFFFSFEETDKSQAFSTALEAATRLCQILSVETGRYFTFDIVQATIEPEGAPIQLPHVAKLIKLAVYNLAQLDVWLENAEAFYFDNDNVLEQSLAYYHHAMRMLEEIREIGNLFTFDANMLVSETILNFYMAASTIVGDPSKDKDYQSRYKSFNISLDAWQDVEKLRRIRNDQGVAHYSLDPERLRKLEANLRFAVNTAKSILMSYMSFNAGRS